MKQLLLFIRLYVVAGGVYVGSYFIYLDKFLWRSTARFVLDIGEKHERKTSILCKIYWMSSFKNVFVGETFTTSIQGIILNISG